MASIRKFNITLPHTFYSDLVTESLHLLINDISHEFKKNGYKYPVSDMCALTECCCYLIICLLCSLTLILTATTRQIPPPPLKNCQKW